MSCKSEKLPRGGRCGEVEALVEGCEEIERLDGL